MASSCYNASDWSVLAVLEFEFAKGHFQISCRQAHIKTFIFIDYFSFCILHITFLIVLCHDVQKEDDLPSGRRTAVQITVQPQFQPQ